MNNKMLKHIHKSTDNHVRFSHNIPNMAYFVNVYIIDIKCLNSDTWADKSLKIENVTQRNPTENCSEQSSIHYKTSTDEKRK